MTEISRARPLPLKFLAPYLLVFLATFQWATNLLLGRLLSTQIGPFTLTASRFTIAGLLYAAMLRWGDPAAPGHTTSGRLSRREWLLLAVMALTGVFGFPALLYLSLHWTTASNAALINGTIPLVTTLLAAWLLREELKARHISGSLVSLVGVILIIGSGSLASLQDHSINSGDLLLLLDTFLWGLYSVISRIVTRSRTALMVTAISTWLGIPLLYLAASLELESHLPLLSPHLIISVVYIAVFPTCIGFFAWNEGVRRLGPALSMAFYNLLPVFGVLLSIVFLSERVTWMHLVGGLLVLGGGIWVIMGRR
jgi:drug/metabolite transporter (DMT)-like permease